MFSTKKGQAATEYLIVLAVVIIIALLVVVVMGGIPGIGTSATGRASAALWSSQDIGLTDYAIDSAGTSNVYILKNNNRNTITVTSVKIGSTVVEADNHSLGAGGSITLDTELDSHVDCGDPGDAFSYDVLINYTDSKTNANYAVTGDGNKLEGTCSS